MEEKLEKTQEMTEESMEAVAGGAPIFDRSTANAPCPMCGNKDYPVWSSFYGSYVCPNPECRAPRTNINNPNSMPVI